MKIIRRSELHIPPRQRSLIAKPALFELRDSILSRSLFHPPVVRMATADDPLPYILIAGERRTRAIDLIAEADLTFLHDDKVILPGELPITLLSNSEAVTFLEAELEENLIREDLPWQDRIRAIATIHQLRVAENPKQTVTDTARELEQKGGIAASGTVVDTLRKNVAQAAIIATHLSDPSIANARNATEAYAAVARKEEARFHAEIIRRRETNPSRNAPNNDNLLGIKLGDLSQILPTLDPNQFDLIFADPPYGIGADSSGFRSRSAVGGHQYVDRGENIRPLIQTIFTQGFRLSKQRANLFMFLDIDLFSWAKDSASAAGWTVFRTPLSWVKSDSEGLAPWGSSGPRRTIEWILYATKGQRGLIHSPVDNLRFNRVSRADRDHAAEKPVDLLQYLIECSTIVGDNILDPCCGTGNSIVAARRSRRRGLGIEIDSTSYGLGLAKLVAPVEPIVPVIAGISTAPESAL